MTTTKTPQTRAGKAKFLVEVIGMRLRFIMLLVVTAVIVGKWDTIMNYWERWTRSDSAPELVAAADVEYFCGMHPKVIRSEPGNCPICGMPLIKRARGAKVELPPGVLGRVQLSPYRITLAGVKTETVRYRMLTREIRTVGTVEPDETRIAKIAARFPGRIEKLHVNFLGTEVGEGAPMAEVYSPTLISAQEELIQAELALRGLEGSGKAEPGELERARELLAYTREKLDLLGITRRQQTAILKRGRSESTLKVESPLGGTVTEKMVFEGQYVEEGMPMYTVVDLAQVWLQAAVYESDLGGIAVGQQVEVSSVSYPDRIFEGRVAFISPVVNRATRTADLRVEIVNPDRLLKLGAYVTARFILPLGRVEELADDGSPLPGGEPRTVFTCTMHPEIRLDEPGVCPVEGCGMFLVPKLIAPGGPEEQVSEGYTCGMHPEELEPEPGECTICNCGQPLKRVRVHKVLAVPEASVIDTGLRKVVYVESEEGVFDARAVRLGHRAGNFYQVVEGLAPGEKVVAEGAFLVDAENRLNPVATEPAGGAGEQQAPASPHQHH